MISLSRREHVEAQGRQDGYETDSFAAGFGSAENLIAMIKTHPLMDDYWKEKLIRPENIHEMPMYLTASYSTGLHCDGSFYTFEDAPTSRKWLRVHASQEWHDLYRPEAIDDLQRFYDCYAKDVQNGWETDTPRVRLSLLGYANSPAKTVVERTETQWPPARQNTCRYYLNAATGSLAREKPSEPATTSYEGHSLSASLVLLFPACH